MGKGVRLNRNKEEQFTVAVTGLGIIAVLIIFWNFGLFGTVGGLAGMGLVTLAILAKKIPSSARLGLAVTGLVILAAFGFLDFEGWRFKR